MEKIYAFNSPDDYDFNEGLVEFSSGSAKLKINESEDSYSQSFADDTDFEYDDELAEFVGGVLRQIDQRPANATLGASYSSSVNASWVSSGSVTGTPNNGASVSGGKLILSGGGNKSVDYDATGRIGISSGAIRLKWTPNYNGTPTDTQYFFDISESEGSGNSRILLMHHSNGSLFLLVNDADGNNIYSNSLITFNATAGQESTIELGWDLSGGGKFYVFGQGYLLAELDGTFSRNDCAFLRIGGSDGDTDCSMDDLITFSANIHTVTHDPTYTVPNNAFVESDAILPEFEYNAGDGTFLEVKNLTTTETNSPRYTIQIGRSGDYLYWNGSAWVVSDGTYAQAVSKSTFIAHVAALDVDAEIYVQMRVHFSDSGVQESIDALSLVILESTTYTTTAQKITPQGRFQAGQLVSFSNSVATPSNTFIKYIVEVDSHKKYWNGTAWVHSNGTYAESNSKQDVEDNIVQLISSDSYVKVIMFLKTDDSTATPELTSVTVQYDEDVGSLRGYLNSILQFIGAESLTDEEYESLPEDLDKNDDLAVYSALLATLESRESTTAMTSRLTDYFQAKGLEITPPSLASSNIFVGSAL